MKELDVFFIFFFGVVGLFWIWIRDFVCEVNYCIYGLINWERINRFFFGSDLFFLNVVYNFLVYCVF